ncbi:MAG: acylphosphatase [Rhodanobacteraceae bacterium]
MTTARFFISGRVQGVFFRASTRAQAQRLDIAGWARNLEDGRVEVLAQSPEPAALEQLADWLEQGPAQADVESVERQRADASRLSGFHIR